uniref:Glyco_hydr_116N domain-containing protein n=1 Tax=Steinernema glaseri TaxID=37863 RepID=A0A1I7Y5J1_9BILA
MLPGLVEQRISSVKADQFIVSVRSADSGTLRYQKVLNAAKPRSSPLSRWEFGFPAERLHYRGLYPRSWTKYEIPEVGIELMCRQVSPVIPNDYEDSTLPLSVFVWEVHNHSAEDLTVTIAFTFRNGTGNSKWDREDVC